MKNAKKLLAITVIISLVIACNFDKSNEDLLQNGSWYYASFTLDGEEQMDRLSPCQKDNTLTFNNDNLVIINDGPLKCDPGIPQVEELMYRITDDNKELVIEGLARYQILKLTEKLLVTKRAYAFGGELKTEIISYGHDNEASNLAAF